MMRGLVFLLRALGGCTHRDTYRERVDGVLSFRCTDCHTLLGPVITRSEQERRLNASAQQTAAARMTAVVVPKKAKKPKGPKVVTMEGRRATK